MSLKESGSVVNIDERRKREESTRSLERPATRFQVASPMDRASFAGNSFLDDLEYNSPFDLLAACDREEKRTSPDGELEWRRDNLRHNELYSVPDFLISNVEMLVGRSAYSRETALVSLIRHSFERQIRDCRLRRWWIAIREGRRLWRQFWRLYWRL